VKPRRSSAFLAIIIIVITGTQDRNPALTRKRRHLTWRIINNNDTNQKP
jgi:hypothetical protein